MSEHCPFCRPRGILFENDLAFVMPDRYPVTHGHLLVIPKRHYADIFSSSRQEIAALLELVARAKEYLEVTYDPQGYNVGVNCGSAAGQSIMHVHIHVIPRYRGDLVDPTGGVRGVIPDRRTYR